MNPQPPAPEGGAMFSKDILKRAIMSPEETAKFKSTARRMVYYVHDDGRILLDDDGSTPPAAQSLAEEASAQLYPYGPADALSEHFAEITDKHRTRAAAILATARAELDEAREKQERYGKEADDWQSQAATLRAERDAAQLKLDVACKLADNYNAEAADLREKVALMESSRDAMQKDAETMASKLSKLRKRLERAEATLLAFRNFAKD